MKIKADLHIHSCLSPCGSLEMSPGRIARILKTRGIQAAALTDHNSALNCRVFGQCCLSNNILPIFGIEVTTVEETHILCLFETVKQAETLGMIIYEKLPDIMNKPDKFGDQVYVDADENILGEVDKYLVNAADITLEELQKIVSGLDGMFIPAHIDKPVFSIPAQLGFLPEMDYTAVETTIIPCPVSSGSIPLLMNSDAHYPDDIACRFSIINADNLSFRNVKDAIIRNQISYRNLYY